ncbi:MAG: hypothetical protein ACREGI_04805 [Candidatus Levyibacteriota bacterium]
MRQHILLGILSFFLFLAATVYLTFPLIFHFTNVASGEYVMAWIYNWNIHSLLTGNISHIFQGNIFYPYTNTIAYSDFLLPSSIFAIIPFLLFHEPMIPSNFTFFTSLLFLGFFTYILSYYLTKNFWASLFAGFLIIFSQQTLDKRVHMQVLAVALIPIAILFFLHFFKTKKLRFFAISLGLFIIQTYNNFMAGYFLIFSYIFLSIFLLWKNKKNQLLLFQKKTLFVLILGIVTLVPLCIPYIEVSQQFHYVRDIRDAIHFAVQPEDLLVVSGYSRLFGIVTIFSDPTKYPPLAEIKSAFPGVIFSLLSLVIIGGMLRKIKNKLFLAFICVALFGFILSFGPAMHLGRKTIHHPFLIPLPYAILYYVAPGFQAFRDSARFEMLFVISMPIAIALFLNDFLQKKKKWIVVVLYLFLFFGTMWEFNFPMRFDPAKTFEQFPPVYQWIKNNTPAHAVIAEEPMYNWDNNPFGDNQEVTREYYATVHFRNIIGGGSGFSPPAWQQFAKHIFAHFPDTQTIAALQKLGVTYIVVHTKEYTILHDEHWVSYNSTPLTGDVVLQKLKQFPQLQMIQKFGDDYVYKFVKK